MPTTADYMWPHFIECQREDFDARRDEKGTHALVIGVSAYPALRNENNKWQLKELSSAARSALEFARWLLSTYQSGSNAPLRTLRLLLSPKDDKEVGNQGDAYVPRATGSNVESALSYWAKDCMRPRGNTAVLYVAGHGVYHPKAGQKLLLEDLSAELSTDRSIDLTSVKEGIENLHLEASYVFVDSCAAVLNSRRHYAGGGVSFPYVQTNEKLPSGFAFASRLGFNAYGTKDGVSVFLGDLLGALDRGGAVAADHNGRWVVNSYALARALGGSEDTHRHPWPGASGKDHEFHVQKGPQGWVKVTLRPSEEAAKFDVSIKNDTGQPDYLGPLSPHPYKKELDPGVHLVELQGAKDRELDPPLRLGLVGPHETFQAEFRAYPR